MVNITMALINGIIIQIIGMLKEKEHKYLHHYLKIFHIGFPPGL